MLTATFTATTTKAILKLYCTATEAIGFYWAKEIRCNEGTVVLPFSPHPSELYDGITKIDKDGINVGVTNSSTNTQLSYDGLRVYDGTAERAYFGESGSFIPDLQVDKITGNFNNRLDYDRLVEVGSGYTYTTISQFLNTLPKDLDGKSVTITTKTSISDRVIINGFYNGYIYISFDGKSHDVSVRALHNPAFVYLIWGTLNPTLVTYPVSVYNATMFVRDIVLAGSNGYAGSAEANGKLTLQGCDLMKRSNGGLFRRWL